MKVIKAIFWSILAIAAVLGVLYLTGILYPDGEKAESYPNTDWMAALPDTRKLSEINIPGTHDSATQYIFPTYFLQDQNTSITEQLMNGYRYLDIRVALAGPLGEEELVMKNSFGQCRRGTAIWDETLTYHQVVRETLDFLKAHPGETVIFVVKPENSDDNPERVRELIEAEIEEDSKLWFTRNTIPLLREVRGKIVLCRRYEDGKGLNFNWEDQGDAAVLRDPAAPMDMSYTEKVYVQDRYHYSPDDKWNAFTGTLKDSKAGRNAFMLNFLSISYGTIPHPAKDAKDLNERFLQMPLQKGQIYGVMLFDFATPEIAAKVIGTNG